MKDKKPFILPPHANIPKEWIVHEDGFHLYVAMPSVSRCVGKDSYRVKIAKYTREIECPCPGFSTHGECRHVSALIWITSREKKRKHSTGVTDTSVESMMSMTRKELADRQREVFQALMDKGPLSIRELALERNTDAKNITGRLMDLRIMGIVECAGHKLDQVTNKRVKIWDVT